jgi:hypothetical protein
VQTLSADIEAAKEVLRTYRSWYFDVPEISLSVRSSRCESREDLCAKTFKLDEVFSGENTTSTFNLSVDKVVQNKTNNKIPVPLMVVNE